MTEPVYYAQVPNWGRQVVGNAKIFEFWVYLHEKAENSSRVFWHRQETLAEEFGVAVSTVSRWIRHLRSVGALITKYRWGRTGKRVSDLIKLSWQDPRLVEPTWDDQGPSPACPLADDVHKGTKPTTTFTSFQSVKGRRQDQPPSLRSVNSSLRSVTHAQHADQSSQNQDQETGRANMAHAAECTGQASLFTEEDELDLDVRSEARETSGVSVSRARKGGTSPVRKMMAYWLSGRVSRPQRHVILGMGRAIKSCYEHGVPEEEIRDGLDEIMRQGLDIFPRHLTVRCGVAGRDRRKKRDYNKDVLRTHLPKYSTMTPERAYAVDDRRKSEVLTPEQIREQMRSWRESPTPASGASSSTSSPSAPSVPEPEPSKPAGPTYDKRWDRVFANEQAIYARHNPDVDLSQGKTIKGVMSDLLASLQ